MTKYRLTAKAFIGDTLFDPERMNPPIIEYEGPLGPHFEPVDAEGQAKLEAYYKENPSAGINPIDAIPVQGATAQQVEIVASTPTVAVADTTARAGDKK